MGTEQKSSEFKGTVKELKGYRLKLKHFRI